ncbi:glycoside hydrolase family 18 protein [Undibacterium sp. TS12]|uniref:glycoside hydrolase family 18 protein n=1 Tax=Undibacterium sp. TS12 TaxID=2908202 RepID=UPI001F4CD61D|nr:glycoside hydrolase family 18 protein [Undibacterium sp. TS12]MCH8621439.1 glycoside hydrolase family 18 protein [Undibacterium sp. TS12]
MKNTHHHHYRSLIKGLLSTLVLCLSPLSQAAPVSKPVVIGYYLLEKDQINNYDQGKIDFPVSAITPDKARMLTHINYSFLNINEQGQCALEDGTNPDMARKVFGELQALKKYNTGLHVLFSIGGWAYTNDDSPTVERYRLAAASGASRQKLAQSCVAFMREYGFDGIDIDWEYPRKEDAQNFVALLKEIRQQLQQVQGPGKPAYQLTIAAAGGAFNMARTYLHLPQIAAQLDYINLMTYDLNGPWEKQTNHNAHLYGAAGEHLFDNPLRALPFEPALSSTELEKRFPSPFALTVDAAVQQYLQAGVPASKLVLGLPFYGRAFFQVTADKQGLHQAFVTPAGDVYQGDPGLLKACDACTARKDPRLATYADIKKMLAAKAGYVRFFGEDTKVPWLYNQAEKIFVSYDDEESFAYKTAYIKKYRLAGAMFWHLGQDDEQGSLLRSLHQGLSGKSVKVKLSGGLHYQGRD